MPQAVYITGLVLFDISGQVMIDGMNKPINVR